VISAFVEKFEPEATYFAGGRWVDGARLIRRRDWRSPSRQPQDHVAVALARAAL
jgi:hypothetical protein